MDNNLNQNPQILIIGASGRVGKEIFKILKNKDSVYDVFGTYYNNKIYNRQSKLLAKQQKSAYISD